MRCEIQIFKKLYIYIYIHLDYSKLEFLSCIKIIIINKKMACTCNDVNFKITTSILTHKLLVAPIFG